MTAKPPALLALILLAQSALADQFDGVRKKIHAGLEQHQVASLAVAVAKDGKILWEEGFGLADRERNIRATEHTVYSLASISKPFTATGLMTLVERGLIDLDKPVNDYLGDAKLEGYAGNASGATVAAVGSHTAGLPLHYQFFLEGEAYARPSMDETLRKYGILVTKPGERYQYSNLGFGILDYLIERKSGKPYPAYMREAVFQPLGLEHMAIPVTGSELDDSREWAVRYWNLDTPLPFYDFDHRGGSAVYSCAHDLVRFAIFHLGQLEKGRKPILKKSSIQRMQKPIAHTGPGRRYGLGWAIEEGRMGVRIVSHTGGMGGVATSLAFAPDEGLAVVVLTNGGSSLPHDISHEVFAALLPEYARNLAKPREPANTAADELPEAVLGTWRGHVQTYTARLPLVLEIGPNSATASLADNPVVPLRNLHMQDGYLAANIDGDIGTPDANRREYALHFSLRPRGEVLNGALSAIGKSSPKLPNALASWVELQKSQP